MRWAFIIEICYYPVRASARRLRPDAAGVGLCVLPCFIGDDDGRLVRASAPIPELSHDDDRHAPAIRRTAWRSCSAITRRSLPAKRHVHHDPDRDSLDTAGRQRANFDAPNFDAIAFHGYLGRQDPIQIQQGGKSDEAMRFGRADISDQSLAVQMSRCSGDSVVILIIVENNSISNYWCI